MRCRGGELHRRHLGEAKRIKSALRGWWRNLELYALAAVALGIVAMQITSMNQGLRHADVVIVIPTFFALGVLFSLVQAQLAFGELNELKGLQNIIIFGAGVVLAGAQGIQRPRMTQNDLVSEGISLAELSRIYYRISRKRPRTA